MIHCTGDMEKSREMRTGLAAGFGNEGFGSSPGIMSFSGAK